MAFIVDDNETMWFTEQNSPTVNGEWKVKSIDGDTCRPNGEFEGIVFARHVVAVLEDVNAISEQDIVMENQREDSRVEAGRPTPRVPFKFRRRNR